MVDKPTPEELAEGLRHQALQYAMSCQRPEDKISDIIANASVIEAFIKGELDTKPTVERLVPRNVDARAR